MAAYKQIQFHREMAGSFLKFSCCQGLEKEFTIQGELTTGGVFEKKN